MIKKNPEKIVTSYHFQGTRDTRITIFNKLHTVYYVVRKMSTEFMKKMYTRQF